MLLIVIKLRRSGYIRFWRIDLFLKRKQERYVHISSYLRSLTDLSCTQGLWVVGSKYTIADICIFSWVNWAEWAGVPTSPFPTVEKWLKTIQERPAVEKGVNIPDKFEMKEAMKTKEGEEEYAKHHSNWVMKGQDEDQKRHK